ncbi:GNAT family N-acetyltransferase [Pinisolibacter sp.]|uniref:GNAT family N-acetyltransferase n=1 Tax=Pinisolibacter sp. TaxID=2172024 RepID=UPI002FDEA556
MTTHTPVIRPETPAEDAAIEALHEHAFGPGRFARTAFRLREGVACDPDLSLVALVDGRLAGSVKLTAIRIGDAPSLLLGPLAVDPDHGSRGLGRALVRAAVEKARALGHRSILLVGDAPYYGPLGFHHVKPTDVIMPGPVDTARVLLCELVEGAAAEAKGRVKSARWG